MSDLREYNYNNSVVFRKTTEKWGGLSIMARGYPIVVNDIKIQSSETLYQAMRFTAYPEVQKEILSQNNPMYGKRISRKYHSLTRTCWDQERVAIMKWAVCVKLVKIGKNSQLFFFLPVINQSLSILKKISFGG